MLNSYYKVVFLLFTLFVSETVLEAKQARSNLQPAASGNFSKQQVDLLVKRFAGKAYKDFSDFCLSVYQSSTLTLKPEQSLAIGNFALNREMTGRQREILFRLLGVYAQLKYGGDALRSLGDLVEIPTVHDSKVPQHENENFLAAAQLLKGMAKDYGLKFRNVDNRVYEISFPWRKTKGETVALHAHVDVASVGSKKWVLADGKQLDPFKLTRVGSKFYGRGAQDHKNAIIATMYAMRVIVEERVRLFNNIRLLINTTDEATGEAMPYYLQRNRMPDYNIALNGAYPVVIAEKGYGIIKATFPIVASGTLTAGQSVFLNVSGSLAYSQIPTVSRATLKSANVKALIREINQRSPDFVNKNGGDFALKAVSDGELVSIELSGVSAHSSEPENGVNPVSRMMLFIHQLTQAGVVQRNHITDVAAYAVENWGLGYLGKTMGIQYQHDFMGPLTASMTSLSDDGNVLELAVNLHIPKGKSLLDLERQITNELLAWRLKNSARFEFSIKTKAPMYRDPTGLWIKALRSVATESLSLSDEFGSSARGTSIHDLPNGVQFGLAMPNEKYTDHNALEYKTVDQFLTDLQIVTEMIARVGQMQHLD